MSRATLYCGAVLLLLTGCKSRYVELTVKNQSGAAVRTVEVDYPGGSFGKAQIPADQEFRYRFKSLQDGTLKMSFSDASGKFHVSDGPKWRENKSGRIEIDIATGNDVKWIARGND
ncbi:MAG: hypothetical protein NVS9B15_08260 [Acidobacteriaceae bacterium]